MALPNINKDDILEALGLESRGGWIGTAAAAFGIGLAVGAAAALLLAPKSGSELREELANRVNRARERVQQEMPTNQPRSTI
jgi:gas vesicle protein